MAKKNYLQKHNNSSVRRWLSLDNAAKMYPAVLRRHYSTFFRLEVFFTESIYADALQSALADTLRRYPLFQTCLKRGLFWYFLEECEQKPIIKPAKGIAPCQYQRLKSTKNPLWRIFVSNTRMIFEVSHILTDGIGASEFLKTLICRYYEYAYTELKDWHNVKRIDELPSEEEMELSYKKHSTHRNTGVLKNPQSFQYPDKRGYSYMLTHLIMDVNSLKDRSKSMGTNIVGFLTSVHLYAIQQLYGRYFKKNRGVVRELILVNLRPFFNSQTIRNFYLFVMLGLDFSLGHYDFDEIVHKVQGQLKNLIDPREIRRQFSHYVRIERNVFNRIVPWFIKNPIVRSAQFLSGETRMVGSVSNLGNFFLPESVKECVERVLFCPPPSRYMGRNISIIGYKNEITLTTGRYIISNNVEREMTKILLAQNINVLYLDK